MKKTLYYPYGNRLFFTQPLHTELHKTTEFSTLFPQQNLPTGTVFANFYKKCGIRDL